MPVPARDILKAFSPRIVFKAISLLDKSTAIVVGVSWLAAICVLIVALMAVHSSVETKRAADTALITEPALPVPVQTLISAHDAQSIVDRLQHQFPDIKFDLGPKQEISIKADDGSKFHQWITALSYVDTMAPKFRWTLTEFCVGKCSNGLMHATISGQNITFSMPSS